MKTKKILCVNLSEEKVELGRISTNITKRRSVQRKPMKWYNTIWGINYGIVLNTKFSSNVRLWRRCAGLFKMSEYESITTENKKSLAKDVFKNKVVIIIGRSQLDVLK